MSGKLDGFDRVVQALLALVALICLANGVYMLGDPFGWYFRIDTVRFTGPPNQHFIRDIGLAYLASGALLAFSAVEPRLRWRAALAGASWIMFHGLLHLWEPLVGLCSAEVFWRASPATLGPPVLAAAALVILFARQRIAPAGLPDALVLGTIDAISQGDGAYAREIAKAPGRPFEKFKHFMPLSAHRHDAPADLIGMARIGAALAEDCGPCTLITARAALSDGVERDTVNAALGARLQPGDCKLGFDFGRAVAARDPDAFALGDAIEARFGRTVRLELALAAANARVYPAIKRGLGLTKSCGVVPLQV